MAGTPVLGAHEVHSTMHSCIVRVETADAVLYVKASRSGSEAAVTERIARSRHVPVPEIVRADVVAGLLLTRDGGRTLDEVSSIEPWLAAADALARLHTEVVPATLDDLQVPRHNLQTVATHYAALVDDRARLTALGTTPAEIQALSAAMPAVLDAFSRMATMDVGSAVVHGDAHPRNVLVDRERVRWFDWSEAGIGHPAFDAGVFLAWATHPRRRLVVCRHHPDVGTRWWSRWLRAMDVPLAAWDPLDAMLVGLAHRAVAYDEQLEATVSEPGGERPAYVRYALKWLLGCLATAPR